MAAVTRPIFERYPGTRSVPWVPLATLPTPVEEMAWLAEDAGCESAWVKRDDLSAARYGGNKVRKLEFLIGEALAEEATDLVTFGAAGSNHALATAIYGADAGLAVHSMLMPQPNAGYVSRNLLASTAVGADLHFSPDRRAALASAAELRRRLHEHGRLAHVVPFGGTSPASTLGFVNAGLELAAQVEQGLLPEPDVLFVPLGSMGTFAGLALGLRASGMKTDVVGVPVLSEGDETETMVLDAILQAQGLLANADPSFAAGEWQVEDIGIARGFLGDGYAAKTAEGLAAVALMERHTGIRLETTYTGKTLAALLASGRAGALRGRTVVFWDTYNSRDVSDLVRASDPERLPSDLREYLDEGAQ